MVFCHSSVHDRLPSFEVGARCIVDRPVFTPLAEFRIRDGFFFFFSCRDLVIIVFFGNLRRAIKLVLNSPTRLSTVVSVWSVAHTIRK